MDMVVYCHILYACVCVCVCDEKGTLWKNNEGAVKHWLADDKFITMKA